MEIYTNTTLRKEKTVRISDWEISPLSAQQISYAAEDTYAGILIYCNMIEKIMRSKNIPNESQKIYIIELLTQEVANAHRAKSSDAKEE